MMQPRRTQQSNAATISTALSGVAIVAEGGGQRGIYTAGVLDAFLDQQFNPFQIGLGVSAGAQNLLAYFLGESGFAKRAISELTAAPGFFLPHRFLGPRDVIDLNHYFETTMVDPEYRLSYQHIAKVQRQRKLIFVATNSENLEPAYLKPSKQNVVDYLKASSAVPFLYKAPLIDHEQQLVDGGVADPIPVCKAIEMGAKHIVVIRTVSAETEQSSWRQRISALPIKRAIPNVILEMLAVHEAAYTKAIDTMRSPPEGVSITHIAPERPLHCHAFGSSADAMMTDYDTGVASGHLAMERLRNSLPMLTPEKAEYKELA